MKRFRVISEEKLKAHREKFLIDPYINQFFILALHIGAVESATLTQALRRGEDVNARVEYLAKNKDIYFVPKICKN